MSIYVRWAGPGLSRVSAQPVTNSWQREAIRFIAANGGEANRKEVFMSLLRQGCPEQKAKNVLTMLTSFGFTIPTSRSKLKCSDWALNLIGRSSSKEEALVGLFMGIMTGGMAQKRLAEMAGTRGGTRLILGTLREIERREPEYRRVSLELLCDEMSESGKVSVYCLLQMLAQPSRSGVDGGDPFALGVVSTSGKSSRPSESFVTLNEEVFRSYQLAAMSRYMVQILPELFGEKYGTDLQTAIAKKLDMVSAESLRDKLQGMPPVWLDENDLDSLLLELTREIGFEWWAEDERGGSRGLLNNQQYAYAKVTLEPKVLPLKSPFHALF